MAKYTKYTACDATVSRMRIVSNSRTIQDMSRPSRSTVTSDVVSLLFVCLIRSSTSSRTLVTISPQQMIPFPTYLMISSSLIPNACTDNVPATQWAMFEYDKDEPIPDTSQTLITQCKARFPLPELTARVDGWPVSITRQHGPCWRARVSTSRVDGPSTRLVETRLYVYESRQTLLKDNSSPTKDRSLTITPVFQPHWSDPKL